MALLISASINWGAFGSETSGSKVADKKTEEVVYTVRLRMRQGQSTWEDSFPATGSSPIRIAHVVTAGCPANSTYMKVLVRAAGTKNWQRATLSKGYHHYEGGAFDGIRFEIDQPYYSSLTCRWKVYAGAGVSSGEDTLLGAIEYPGGFAQNLEIAVPAKKITHFRLAVPKFCQAVEILEASTVTEGVKDKAKLINKESNLYSVNDASGLRISKILITANGPLQSACQIPVFIQEK